MLSLMMSITVCVGTGFELVDQIQVRQRSTVEIRNAPRAEVCRINLPVVRADESLSPASFLCRHVPKLCDHFFDDLCVSFEWHARLLTIFF